MQILYFFLLLAAFTAVVTAASPAIDDYDDINDLLILPDDFDFSAHPALNMTLLRELRAANAPLPELDESILSRYIHRANTTGDATTMNSEKLFCETTPYISPWNVQVKMNAEYLFSIGNKFCCMEKEDKLCQLMALTSSAASDICAKAKTTCVKCKWAAQANVDVADKCKIGIWSGGFKRFVPFHSAAQVAWTDRQAGDMSMKSVPRIMSMSTFTTTSTRVDSVACWRR
jgi:hypothetical protein